MDIAARWCAVGRRRVVKRTHALKGARRRARKAADERRRLRNPLPFVEYRLTLPPWADGDGTPGGPYCNQGDLPKHGGYGR